MNVRVENRSPRTVTRAGHTFEPGQTVEVEATGLALRELHACAHLTVTPADEPDPREGKRTTDVPDLADEVVAWVGDDPERAKSAWVVEHGRSRGPRTTVTDALEPLVSDAVPAEETTEQEPDEG